jgi:sulfate adenylyltransferase subunit 1
MNAGVLRFITAGSVDDGKSTLIGRLLFDSKGIYADQLASLQRAKHKRTAGEAVDLSLLTDGLEAEREQGITIDVAYRYFSTPRRKFIIADTPGHEQYTRNMITGASTADAMIILIDAVKFQNSHGLLLQTKRHSTIAQLLQIKHIIVAVNKMDLVNYDQAVYERIVEAYKEFSLKLGIQKFYPLPLSALRGDNVVQASPKTPWYSGGPLINLLESLETKSAVQRQGFRFPVQWVARTAGPEAKDFRGYMGRVEAGEVHPGDELIIQPSGHKATVKEILTFDGSRPLATAGDSVTLLLNEHADISRGDLLTSVTQPAQLVKTFAADVCWLSEDALDLKHKYWLKHTTKQTTARVLEIESLLDINTQERKPAAGLKLNDIARVKISVRDPLAVDPFNVNPATGSFILIDEVTHQTAAAGMIR